jgi:hypothetical protein
LLRAADEACDHADMEPGKAGEALKSSGGGVEATTHDMVPGKQALAENADSASADDAQSVLAASAGTSLFGAKPPWSARGDDAGSGDGGGARGEGWSLGPSVKAMDAPAERESEITSRTLFRAPGASSGRRTVGIGEPVMLSAPGGGRWSASAAAPNAADQGHGRSFRWTAPEQPGTVTISLDKGGSTQTATFSVVAPQDIAFEKIREATPKEIGQRVGAGMLTKVNLLPRTVAFDALTWAEEPGPASNATGFFEKNVPPAHEPALQPMRANDKLADLAVYFNRTLPTRGGSFDWEIPNTLMMAGGQSVTTLSSVQTVRLEESPREGFVTVSKRGAGTAPAVSQTRAPGGARVAREIAPAGGGGHGCFGQTPTPLSATGKHVVGDVLDDVSNKPATASDPKDDPNEVPPQFKALPPEVIQLLHRSRGRLKNGKNLLFTPGVPFWDIVTNDLGMHHLHTLMQIYKGTAKAGLWPMISAIDEIYTYPSSWGIHFVSTGNPAALVKNGDWGRDNPQYLVGREHTNGHQYEWYRQNTGAGNAGLHLGVDKGAGDHDVHWDPTNPMERVGEGKVEVVVNPLVLIGGPPVQIVQHAKGDAVYSPTAVAKHFAEIKGTAGSKNAEPTQAFIRGWALDESRKHARNYVNHERGARANTDHIGRSEKVVADVEAVIKLIEPLAQQMRQLAMQEDAATENARPVLLARIESVRAQLIKALAALFQHMKAEAPAVDAKGYDTEAGWADNTHAAYDTSLALVQGRAKK